MKRTVVKKEAVTPPSPTPRQGTIKWLNKGGRFYMKDGRVIERKATFFAHPDEIPKAFRDIVVPAEPIREEDYTPVVGGYEARKREDGTFDIVDSRGRAINEKPMSEEDTKAILDKLN